MSDAYTLIDLRYGSQSAYRRALDEARETIGGDFPFDALLSTPMMGIWWHRGDPSGRSYLARLLSRHGLTGRLSVESDAFGVARIRWTGFTARLLHRIPRDLDLTPPHTERSDR